VYFVSEQRGHLRLDITFFRNIPFTLIVSIFYLFNKGMERSEEGRGEQRVMKMLQFFLKSSAFLPRKLRFLRSNFRQKQLLTLVKIRKNG